MFIGALVNLGVALPALSHSFSRVSVNTTIMNGKMTANRLSLCLTPTVCVVIGIFSPLSVQLVNLHRVSE